MVYVYDIGGGEGGGKVIRGLDDPGAAHGYCYLNVSIEIGIVVAGKNFQLIYIHPFKRRHLSPPPGHRRRRPRSKSYYFVLVSRPPRRELILQSKYIYYFMNFVKSFYTKVRSVSQGEQGGDTVDG